MRKIIALGGGEIGRPGKKMETRSIDLETIRLTGKSHPKLLFLRTASMDSLGYIETVKHYFWDILGCEVDILCLWGNPLSEAERQEKILSSDIVYVGGGNTLKMMKCWRKYGVDIVLRQAWESGVIMSGLSAGSICWFQSGQSDSRKQSEGDKDFGFMKVRGMGFIPWLHCPHYDTEMRRRPELLSRMQKQSWVAIALDECCAIEIIDDTYRILSSKSAAKAYRVYRKWDTVIEEEIKQGEEFRSMKELFNK